MCTVRKKIRIKNWIGSAFIGSILLALLWLQVDIRDTIRYTQPFTDQHQDERFEILEKSCFEFCGDYEEFKRNDEIKKQQLHELILNNNMEITIIQSQLKSYKK
jgi:hypothetical protein